LLVLGSQFDHSGLDDFEQALDKIFFGNDSIGGRFGQEEVLIDPKFALAPLVETDVRLIQ
jgi:hypothetical protein